MAILSFIKGLNENIKEFALAKSVAADIVNAVSFEAKF